MSSDTLPFLDAELQSLNAERERLRAALHRVDDRMEYISSLRERFLAQKGRPMQGDAGVTDTHSEISSSNGNPPRRMHATEAIRAFIRNHPGASRREIVDGALSSTASSSPNVRRVLDARVRQMLAHGDLVQNEEGGLRLPAEPVAAIPLPPNRIF